MSSEIITKNDLKAILDEILPSCAVDYVVEQGTNSGWYYRKWNSGRSEAWCAYSVGSVAITISSPAYGGYRSDEMTATIPSGIFNTTPTVIGQKHTSQGGWIANCYGKSATQVGFFYGSGSSLTITYQYIALYAFGTWK